MLTGINITNKFVILIPAVHFINLINNLKPLLTFLKYVCINKYVGFFLLKACCVALLITVVKG